MEYYKSILSLAKEAFTISSKLFNKDQSIFLEGNIYSNSLIVGEALGAKEIALKRIFIGDSVYVFHYF